MKINRNELYLFNQDPLVASACRDFAAYWQPGSALNACFDNEIEVEHDEAYHVISFTVTLTERLDLQLAVEFNNILCRFPSEWDWDVTKDKCTFTILDWRLSSAS